MRKPPVSLLSGQQAAPEPMLELNMTPLIDVMLVLIIMMIITIPRMNHTTALDLGRSPADATIPPVVTIDVDFDGALSWDGVALDRDGLAGKLRTLARAATPTQVQVRPNRLAPYKVVVAVMASAQRAGVRGLGIVGNEQFL